MVMKKIFLIILLGILAPTLGARAFSLSPLKYIFSVERGESTVITVTLNNYESGVIALEPAVVGMKTDKAGRPVYDSTAEVIGWVKSDWNFINLKEGQGQKVHFLVTVPAGAYPGDYYLGVGAKRVAGVGAVSIGEQLLTVVNLKVAGTAREDLVVKKFEVSGKFFEKNKKFNLEIENKGNVEMPISAVLKISDWRGQIILEQPVAVGNKILPLASRVASTDFVIARSEATRQSIVPGLYQVDLTVDYGLTKQKITAVENFWYVPTWTLGVLVGVIILVGLIIFIKNRKNFGY